MSSSSVVTATVDPPISTSTAASTCASMPSRSVSAPRVASATRRGRCEVEDGPVAVPENAAPAMPRVTETTASLPRRSVVMLVRAGRGAEGSAPASGLFARVDADCSTSAPSGIWTTLTIRWSMSRSNCAIAIDCTSRTTCLAGLTSAATTWTSSGSASGSVRTLASRMPGTARSAASNSGSRRRAVMIPPVDTRGRVMRPRPSPIRAEQVG